MNISKVIARQILDSRGNPTVEADIWIDGRFAGRAAVPSGASTGTFEAHELRDGGPEYHGKGVRNAIANIETEIAPAIMGMPVIEQKRIDQTMCELDGTENKSRLGANAILAVSLACAHAAANTEGKLLYAHIADLHKTSQPSLPLPMMNVLNGGAHASNSSDFQEFMIVPTGADSYQAAVRMGAEIFAELKQLIAHRGHSTAVGDEGGFTFPVRKNSEMLDLLMEAVQSAGYVPGENVHFALDVAASEFFVENMYSLTREETALSRNELIDYLKELSDQYPIVSIEDGLDQNDWDGWQELKQRLGTLQLVGDDLLVTNPQRLEKAIELKAANSILIKPNQIGTVSETLEAIRLAQQHSFTTIVSHRSGETEDVSIAHIAVGTAAGQIKTGSLSRSERTAKHNELMRLESIDEHLRLEKPLPKVSPI